MKAHILVWYMKLDQRSAGVTHQTKNRMELAILIGRDKILVIVDEEFELTK